MDKSNKMLIDSTHPEETRVVVLKNGRVEEFDFESAARKLLRGNIYLAKVTRVEPSLQAAFVEYGGNRHGFLAFNEIHPDYYQIPVADREALKEEEAAIEAEEEARADARAEARANRHRDRGGNQDATDARDATAEHAVGDFLPDDQIDTTPRAESYQDANTVTDDREPMAVTDPQPGFIDEQGADKPAAALAIGGETESIVEPHRTDAHNEGSTVHDSAEGHGGHIEEVAEVAEAPEIVNATELDDVGSEDAMEEVPERTRRQRRRQYKIQEVIRRRQIILVQVVKEERGNKGAALTTYLSLAGRYTVLMPNTGRGGGISRKITQAQDRKRLKAIAQELEVPEGMGLIIRTAGASRNKQEIKRDFEYLMRLWESVRELTLESTAPSLVYEEGNLIKRSIRDLYAKDVEEIVVAGDDAHKEASSFMGMLMPSHTRNVIKYDHPDPLFARYRIEQQLNAMFSPHVTLKSGGYLVINQTEALVAIDVNSGKSTREFSIEETALNTNIEAADEIARQLKLRDLAGLIVIDFIDMEERRNNRKVENRLKDALRHDRARIQVGRISHFGLMEMSRQRMRTGVLEGSTSQCPHCQGTGIIRSTESVALAVLRGIEDYLMRDSRSSITAATTAHVALYILNNKRGYISEMEHRFGVSIAVQSSDRMQGANFSIEKSAAPVQPKRAQQRAAVNMDWGFSGEPQESGDDAGDYDNAPPPEHRSHDHDYDSESDNDHDHESHASGERSGEARDDEQGSRRGRRRRRRGRGRNGEQRNDDRYGVGGSNGHRYADDQPRGAFDQGERGDVEQVARDDEDGLESGSDSHESLHRDHDQPRDETGDQDGERRGRRRRRGRRGGRRRDREGGFAQGADGPSGERNQESEGSNGGSWDQDRERSASGGRDAESKIDASHQSDERGDPDRHTPSLAQDERRTEPSLEVVRHEPVVAVEAEPRLTRQNPTPTPPMEPESVPVVDEPPKPARKGWWQRRVLGE